MRIPVLPSFTPEFHANLERMATLAREANRVAARYEEMFERMAKDEARLANMLEQLFWPPPLLLPAALVSEMARGFERSELSSAEIDELFVEFYTADVLEGMITRWGEQGHIPHRLPILRDAVRAHCDGRYTLSIPAVLPQLEGTIAEMFGHRGKIRGQHVQKYHAAAFAGAPASDNGGVNFFRAVLLDRFEWGDPIPLFSRHAILHGADTCYATAANSLRAFVTLDQFLNAVQYVSGGTGRRYHRSSCSAARRASLPRRTFGSREDAEAAGLMPCQRCIGTRATSYPW